MEEARGPEWLEAAFSALGAKEDASGSLARLRRQLLFLLELDKAKSVSRRTYLTDGTRRETDGEHMWHAAVAAAVLAEHSDGEIDPARLALMLAVHDVVEIDAGDTFLYDTAGQASKLEREEKAAERIFGLLPEDQRARFSSLWEEFEARETPTAKMAAAIDRLLPLLMNRALDGRSWKENGIGAERVLEANCHIEEGSSELWSVCKRVLSDAMADGTLPSSRDAAGAEESPPV